MIILFFYIFSIFHKNLNYFHQFSFKFKLKHAEKPRYHNGQSIEFESKLIGFKLWLDCSM